MKSKSPYRAEALALAQDRDYATVRKSYDWNGYTVYRAYYAPGTIPPCTGLPNVILCNDQEVRFAYLEEGMAYFEANPRRKAASV